MQGKKAHMALLTAGILLLTCLFSPAAAREDPEYDEISVFLTVQDIGVLEMPAVIYQQQLYLPVADVFDFLKIRNSLSPGLDSVWGFFIQPQAVFMVDHKHHRISYQGKAFKLLPNDLIRTPTNLYLKLDYFGQVFGLTGTFNFRSLSATITTKLELPAIREKRQEEMRRNISRLKGEAKADTSIDSRHPFFHFGMADWAVIATQRLKGANDTRLNLALGGIIAGGETNVSLNYNNYDSKNVSPLHNSSIVKPFDERLQYYRWRYVNNNWKAVRQIIAGKIFAVATSSVYAPIVGVQFTNTPTLYRRSFGTYTLSNFTSPGWKVELYVNNVLVDYTVADPSGFFTFQVPLVYGNTQMKLRFYGPWGEERMNEQTMNIPFNFLPLHQFEYMVSAGIVEDERNSQFSRVSFNYGATSRITIGGGIEYLSSVTKAKNMPFINASLRLTSNLLFSSEYTYGVRAIGTVSYSLPSNLQLEGSYTRYKKGQQAINNNFLEERKLAVAMPFTGNNFAVYSRFILHQILLPGTQYTTASCVLSGAVAGIGTNFTTYALFTTPEPPYLYSNLSLSLPLPALRLLITPQVQYEYNQHRFISAKCELGKYLFQRGFMDVFYEQNFKSRFNSIGIGFRYDLSFAQAGVSARSGNSTTTLVQSARGSLVYDGNTHYLSASNRISVGTGGIVLLPYLDLNSNGLRDTGEPKAPGVKLNISAGRVIYDNRDTTIRVLDLEPYAPYYIDLGRSSFDNIAWQLSKRTLQVTIDPNRLKSIAVPVSVMGEASGTVYLLENNERKGLGRIVVCIYGKDSTLAGRTLTESDGYFSFLGLQPGTYTAKIDAVQLGKLKMSVAPAMISFTIKQRREGDVADGLEFVLQ